MRAARPGVREPQASELTIGPLSQVLAGPARDGEDILFADIASDELPPAKFDFDEAVALQEHYRVAA